MAQSFQNNEHKESGIDSLARCVDKNWFKNFPHEVSYCYNSRGFRDLEWPTQLKQAIWCVGDSFTVGLGSPFDHTWPQVLRQRSQRDVINISLDGASNAWIARKCQTILTQVNPDVIVVMWSYFHRRELANTAASDVDRRQWFDHAATHEDNLQDFLSCLQSTLDCAAGQSSKLIHFLIPNASPIKNFALPPVDNFMGEVQQLDWARDHHHFDLLTSQSVCDQIISRLSTWPDLCHG
jgi:hypothetical protein